MNNFFNQKEDITIKDIAKICGAKIIGNEDFLIKNIGPLSSHLPNTLSCFHNPKYINEFAGTSSAAVITSEKHIKKAPKNCILIIHEKPYRAYATILKYFYEDKKKFSPGISSKASVHKSAEIHESAYVGDFAVIEAGVKIGENSVIESFSHISLNSVIGCNCHIYPHVSITHTNMGDNVIVKPGAKLGQPGFGFDIDANGPFDLIQTGSLKIGDDVIIGSNTVIDRGAGPDTKIGSKTRIDSNVIIAHNVEIGCNSIIVAQAGIAGSTKIGNSVIIAAQAGIAGHLSIGDGAQILAQSGVMRDIKQGEKVAGSPAVPVRKWHKQTIAINQLSSIKLELDKTTK